MSITPKHLRVIHQEILKGAHTLSGWMMRNAVSTIHSNLDIDDADYSFVAKLSAHMLGDQMPEAEMIEACFHAVKEARGQMLGKKDQASNHDILRDMGAIAYADARLVDTYTGIDGCEDDLNRTQADLIQELRDIVVMCIYMIAEDEYAQYAQLRERIV